MFSRIASSAIVKPARSVASRQSRQVTCVQSLDKAPVIFEEDRFTFKMDNANNTSSSTSSRQLSISATTSKKSLVSAEGIESVLKNIPRDDRMSRTEMEFILREVGGVARSGEPENFFISNEQMMELVSVKKAVWMSLDMPVDAFGVQDDIEWTK